MTDGDALRRAIVADPDDDTPRLIYADWLDENAQPDRAALIRDQIEAVRAEPYSARARAAASRAEKLVAAHRPEWSKHVRPKVVREEYVRGFIGHVVVDVGRFREIAAGLFTAEPVQSVDLVRFSPNFGRESMVPVFGLPEMARVRDLTLPSGMQISDGELDALADAPLLADLATLSLRGNPLPPPWLTKLLAGKGLPNLTGLSVWEMAHLGPGLAAAAHQAGHRRLKKLEVRGIAFKFLDLQRLLTSPCVRELEELVLHRPPKAPDALAQLDLGWTLPLATLRKLDVGGQELGPGAVTELGRLADCQNLRWLGLAGNRLRSGGVRALVESTHLNLNYLDVTDNDLDAADLAALRARFPAALVVG